MAISNQLSARGHTRPRSHEEHSEPANDTASPISRKHINVGTIERIVSGSAGALLILRGLSRRDLTGLLLGTLGGALVYRGATAHCPAYEALGIDTAKQDGRPKRETGQGVRVTRSLLIDKPIEDLYAYWRNLENLTSVMKHLNEVRVIDDRRSHWVAKAPRIAGGKVEWEAEIVVDVPNSAIAWQSLPGGDIQHAGSVEFTRAQGDRGTVVRVDMRYEPPAGQLGRWVAKLFGEEPEQQIRDDLRNFKRVMEIGEVLTLEGQPRGTCLGRGTRTSV